jgi:hypothetical protein
MPFTVLIYSHWLAGKQDVNRPTAYIDSNLSYIASYMIIREYEDTSATVRTEFMLPIMRREGISLGLD